MEFLTIGKTYMIRTLTFYYVGTVVECSALKTVLTNASWIPETGRWHECLKNGEFTEVEPFVQDAIINTTMIVDATLWPHPLPKKVK